MADTQVLFDPFEEQLDLPTSFVEFADDDGRNFEIIGQEDQ